MKDSSYNRVALITGVTGQDGAYLAEFLLQKNYIVHGIKRRSSSFNTPRIDHLYQSPDNPDRKFIMHYGDMTDSTNLIRIIQEVQPDEIYNLAAQSHVQVSYQMPEYSANVNGLGALRILEAVRILGLTQKTRIFQASSASILDNKLQPQFPNLSINPQSPYAVAMLYAYWITINYREAYQMFACNGVMYNHESSVRGETFVTRKIVQAAVKIVLGLQSKMFLGNLSAQRDWGHAQDYVCAMWSILQQDQADDYLLSTGNIYTVRDFARMTFAYLGVEIEFSGRGEQERGVVIDVDIDRLLDLQLDPDVVKLGQTVIKVDSRYYRPLDSNATSIKNEKAKQVLGWKPQYNLESIIAEMVNMDLEQTQKKS